MFELVCELLETIVEIGHFRCYTTNTILKNTDTNQEMLEILLALVHGEAVLAQALLEYYHVQRHQAQ